MVESGKKKYLSDYPQLMAEWNFEKNNGISPNNLAQYSNKKVWWRCKDGHEWSTLVFTRTTVHSGCPYCSGRKVISGVNDLATLCPEIAAEWHPIKNGDLTPDAIAATSGKMVWWQCSNGHEWKALVSNRKRKGSRCPFCSGRKAITGENDLATLHPEIAAEWHPTLNGERFPSEFTTYSNYKAWWRCKEGHEWETPIFNRSLGRGCRICAETKRKKSAISSRLAKNGSLLDHNPQLATEWHPTKNGDLLPSQVLPFSTIEVWWRCKEGHECLYVYIA